MARYQHALIFFLFTQLSLFSIQASAADTGFEQPATLKASEILPANVLKGPYHMVEEKVTNDGFLNRYTIDTPYGKIQVSSTDKLKKYIDEISAIPRMNAVQESDEFKKGIAEKGEDVVEGAKALASDPVGTVGNTISGVGKLFSRAKENMFEGSRSD